MANNLTPGTIPYTGTVPQRDDESLLGAGRVTGEDLLERITRSTGYNSTKSLISSTYYGLNHRGLGLSAPINQDQYGLTFFTKPRLNLGDRNLVLDRTFTPMLSTASESVARAVRAMLDPVGAKFNGRGSGLVDNNQAFIPLLSNTLMSLSGWPDPYVDVYTSRSGLYKEQWAMVDGFSKIYEALDLSANFKNIVDDPISYLFYIWTQYAALVHEGVMDPYPEMIIEHEIDYQTRIYRLVLDQTRRFVTKIAACGAGFPTSNSLGSAFDFNAEKPYSDQNDQISVTFKCLGAIYLDPILVQEFNEVVQIFNPNMRTGGNRRSQHYMLIPPHLEHLFANQGYPQINPDTMAMEWWVDKAHFNLVLSGVKNGYQY